MTNLADRLQAVLDEHRLKQGRNTRGRRDARLDTCTCGRWDRHYKGADGSYDQHLRETVQAALDAPTPNPFATRMAQASFT